MDWRIWKKIGVAVVDSLKAFDPKPEPRLIMTLLVKDEEEMLEKNLIFHKSLGVDGFIVTDNNSSDATPRILRKYRDKGWILEVIHEGATNYEQKRWVDRMIWKAKTDYKADWIINADADELWHTSSGNLKTELKQTRANVLVCEMKCVYPDECTPFWEWDRTVEAVSDPLPYDLSRYSLFARQNKKVIHRADGYLQISMGNHKVAMLPQRKAPGNICIYHYNIRGKQPFLKKMINGGKQLEQNPGKHGGRHWRYFYQLHKEGLLEAEYDRVIGKNSYERLEQDGFIRKDSTIPEWFARLKEE